MSHETHTDVRKKVRALLREAEKEGHAATVKLCTRALASRPDAEAFAQAVALIRGGAPWHQKPARLRRAPKRQRPRE